MSRASTVRPRGASCSPKEWGALLERSRLTALPILRSLEVLECDQVTETALRTFDSDVATMWDG